MKECFAYAQGYAVANTGFDTLSFLKTKRTSAGGRNNNNNKQKKEEEEDD